MSDGFQNSVYDNVVCLFVCLKRVYAASAGNVWMDAFAEWHFKGTEYSKRQDF